MTCIEMDTPSFFSLAFRHKGMACPMRTATLATLALAVLALTVAPCVRARIPEGFTCAPEQRPVRIGTEAGLANRLRVMASFGRECGGFEHITFVWNSTNACEGRFDELFVVPQDMRIVFESNLAVDFATFNPLLHLIHTPLTYEWLCLRPELRHEVHTFVAQSPRYFCVHARQTDLVKALANETNKTGIVYDDAHFMQQAEEQFAKGFAAMYLATDNHATQAKMIARFGDRVLFYDKVGDGHGHRRKTSLHHSVMDLFLCAASQHFVGTPRSTFSELVHNLHNHNLYECNKKAL